MRAHGRSRPEPLNHVGETDTAKENQKDAGAEAEESISHSPKAGQHPDSPGIHHPTRRVLKRNVAACGRCRKRKQRCDGKLPACSSCAAAGVACLLPERLVVRQHDPNCNCTALREQIKSLSDQVNVLNSRLAEKERAWVHSEHSDRDAHTTDQPQTQPQLSPVTSPLRSVRRDDATVEKSCMAVRILRPTFPRRGDSSSPSVSFLSSPWHLWGRTGEHVPDLDKEVDMNLWRSNIEAWPHLVDTFFTRRWPQLPVIHKPTFMEKHLIPFSEAEGQSGDLFSSFQVNMVLAIATTERTAAGVTSNSKLSHRDYFEVATRSLEAVFAADDIDCIQCLLLLAMYGCYEPQSVNMWHVIGLALRLAVGIDLHRQEALVGCSVLEAEMRKRLWWSVYAMDRSISITLGRPLGIQDSDITMPLPEAFTDDQLNNASESPIVPNFVPSPEDTSTFIHIIKLRRIYTDTYKVFHSAGRTNVEDVRDLESIRHRSLLQLNEWLVGAPRYFNQTCMYQTPEWFQIAYHQAIITLHRPSQAAPWHTSGSSGVADLSHTMGAMRLCADSAISLITCYGALYAKNKITYTFVALNALFMAAVAMLHALRASRALRRELTAPVAASNVRLCAKLLRELPDGRAIGESSAQIIERLGRATLSIFDNDSASLPNTAASVTDSAEEVDTEFLLWFGLKSQQLPKQGEPTPSIDVAWNDLLASGFDMYGNMWTDLFL